MKLLKNNFVTALLVIFLGVPELLDAQGYYNRYEYRRKRHEITFGAGASSCLTDVGGSDLPNLNLKTMVSKIHFDQFMILIWQKLVLLVISLTFTT